MTEDEAIKEARRRWHFDVEFHARVHIATETAIRDMHRREDGARVERQHREAISMAAALALVLAEEPIQTLVGG